MGPVFSALRSIRLRSQGKRVIDEPNAEIITAAFASVIFGRRASTVVADPSTLLIARAH